VSRLLLEQRVDSGLGDGFIHFRGRAAGGDTADRLAVHLDGKSTLIGESVREDENLRLAAHELVGGGFGRPPVDRRVTGFFCANWIVLSPAPSAFWRKSKLPLSSTMQIVTWTFRFCASASAAAAEPVNQVVR